MISRINRVFAVAALAGAGTAIGAVVPTTDVKVAQAGYLPAV